VMRLSVQRFIVSFSDVTGLQNTEEQLRQLAAELSESDRRKDEFIAVLAHELRNPLAPIRHAAQVLAAPQLSFQQLQWAQQVITRQATQMARLLDDLLDVARIARGKIALTRSRVLLKDIVDAAVETSRPLLDAKHHRLCVKLLDVTVSLNADSLRLAQALSNLLNNAAKYTDPGGDITVTAYIADETLHLAVKDTGVGIAADALSGIFAMFAQVEGSVGHSEGGLGIGLALVKGLVELHGGTISAHSAGAGQGSEFTIRLPIERGPAAVEKQVQQAPSPPSGLSVLVADDNRDAAESLAMLLQLSGYKVSVANDGRAALSVAQTVRPDVVILDISMPELNGYEVAQALRREPWAMNILIIALSGWGQDRDQQRAKEAGFNRRMTKPVASEDLEACIAQYVMQSAAISERPT
jgi:CheY-like chemotaxis protein/nitrogen-specific signal transduction histidine kinase